MGYEIDYLAVGQKSDDKSGDAIAMRFWDTDVSKSIVITVDGGTRDSGNALVEHIKKYYKTSTVTLAILTHPDADHSSGLRDIIERLDVKCLLIIVPWRHAGEILPIVREADSRVTENSIVSRLQEAYPSVLETLEIAESKGIKVAQPFAYNTPFDLPQTTQLFLLGPSYDAYLKKWLPNYGCLPTQPAKQFGIIEAALTAASKTVKWVKETWDKELLIDPDPNAVNSENNSSVVFAIQQGTNRFLFTGDVGVPALSEALTYGKILGLPINGYNFFDVPHHGSRRNLGPSILNAMFDLPRQDPNCGKSRIAFVSATKDDPKHPSKRITNALNRRAVRVIATAGSNLLHHSSDYINRGWSNAPPTPFFDQVEDIDD